MHGAAATGLDSHSSARTHRRRIVLLSLLGALLTVVGLAVFSWPAIERGYYLWQLRHEPGLVEPWLRAAGDDPVRTAALRKLLRERQGAEVLFGLYLAEYDKRQFDQSTIVDNLTRRKESGSLDDHGYMYLGERNFGYAFMRGNRAMQMYSTMNLPTDAELRRAVLAEMDACVGQSFTVETLPGYEFYIEAIIDGEAKPAPWRSKHLGALKNSRARHVCYFRRINRGGTEKGEPRRSKEEQKKRTAEARRRGEEKN